MVNSIFTNRRAVRNFSSESISDDEIKSLIAAFQTTPCGMHQTDVMGGAARLNDDSELQKELGIDPAFQTSVIVPVGKIGEKPEATDRSNRYQVTIY